MFISFKYIPDNKKVVHSNSLFQLKKYDKSYSDLKYIFHEVSINKRTDIIRELLKDPRVEPFSIYNTNLDTELSNYLNNIFNRTTSYNSDNSIMGDITYSNCVDTLKELILDPRLKIPEDYEYSIYSGAKYGYINIVKEYFTKNFNLNIDMNSLFRNSITNGFKYMIWYISIFPGLYINDYSMYGSLEYKLKNLMMDPISNESIKSYLNILKKILNSGILFMMPELSCSSINILRNSLQDPKIGLSTEGNDILKIAIENKNTEGALELCQDPKINKNDIIAQNITT